MEATVPVSRAPHKMKSVTFADTQETFFFPTSPMPIPVTVPTEVVTPSALLFLQKSTVPTPWPASTVARKPLTAAAKPFVPLLGLPGVAPDASSQSSPQQPDRQKVQLQLELLVQDEIQNDEEECRDMEGTWTYQRNERQFQYVVVRNVHGYVYKQMLNEIEVVAALSEEGGWFMGEVCRDGQCFGCIRLRRTGETMTSNFRHLDQDIWQEDTVASLMEEKDEQPGTSEVGAPCISQTPSQFVPEQEMPRSALDDLVPWEKFEAVVDQVEQQLLAREDCVVDVSVIEGPKGWIVTTYVKPDQLELHAESIQETAQQAMLVAAKESQVVYVLGYKTRPFASMPLGFGCALAVMTDPDNACWGSYTKGVCRSPGKCKLQHPSEKAEVRVMFEPAS